MIRSWILAALACFTVLSCNRDREAAPPPPTTEQPSSGTVQPVEPAVTPRRVIEDFGLRMKDVSITAPADVAGAAIRRAYDGLVQPELLERWAGAPESAPGRAVSSPWPDRIEVTEVSEDSRERAEVAGEVVEVTSTGEAGRVPIRVTLQRFEDRWLITGYRNEPRQEEDSAAAAVEALRSYYDAISARDYERAYRQWGPSGPPNQTLEEFARGFAETESVVLTTGTPSRVEGAAGSRYVEIPVTVTSRTKAGENQRFEGSYTMRRVVVDGAPAAERRWHIHRAAVRRQP
jgi:hypothetical protein